MPYTPLAPRRWNSSKFLRWRRGALCLTNFLPLPDSLTTSSSSSLVLTGRLLHTRRGALFLINFLTKVAILGAPTEKGRSPSCKGKPCAPAPLSCPPQQILDKVQGVPPTTLGYSVVSRPRRGLSLRSDEVDPSASPYFYRPSRQYKE